MSREGKEALSQIEAAMYSDRMKEYFKGIPNSPWNYISYDEQLRIFGKHVSYDYLPEANKRIIRSHFLVHNAAFETLWKYKYGPLLLRLAYCAGRGC